MTIKKFRFKCRRTALRTGALLGWAVTCTLPAFAVGIDTGNEDLTLPWDNTVRLNLGVRTDKQDPRILNSPRPS